MTREEVLRHVREQYGTQPDNPWGEALPGAAVLRQRENRKWYALILPVQRESRPAGGKMRPAACQRAAPHAGHPAGLPYE